MIDCPAEGMWADVMIKPLQGMAFRTMRSELMNCRVNYKDPPKIFEDNETKRGVGTWMTEEEEKQTQPISKIVN